MSAAQGSSCVDAVSVNGDEVIASGACTSGGGGGSLVDSSAKKNGKKRRYSQLPDDILLHIFGYVAMYDAQELERLGIVCNRFHKLVQMVPSLSIDSETWNDKQELLVNITGLILRKTKLERLVVGLKVEKPNSQTEGIDANGLFMAIQLPIAVEAWLMHTRATLTIFDFKSVGMVEGDVTHRILMVVLRYCKGLKHLSIIPDSLQKIYLQNLQIRGPGPHGLTSLSLDKLAMISFGDKSFSDWLKYFFSCFPVLEELSLMNMDIRCPWLGRTPNISSDVAPFRIFSFGVLPNLRSVELSFDVLPGDYDAATRVKIPLVRNLSCIRVLSNGAVQNHGQSKSNNSSNSVYLKIVADSRRQGCSDTAPPEVPSAGNNSKLNAEDVCAEDVCVFDIMASPMMRHASVTVDQLVKLLKVNRSTLKTLYLDVVVSKTELEAQTDALSAIFYGGCGFPNLESLDIYGQNLLVWFVQDFARYDGQPNLSCESDDSDSLRGGGDSESSCDDGEKIRFCVDSEEGKPFKAPSLRHLGLALGWLKEVESHEVVISNSFKFLTHMLWSCPELRDVAVPRTLIDVKRCTAAELAVFDSRIMNKYLRVQRRYPKARLRLYQSK